MLRRRKLASLRNQRGIAMIAIVILVGFGIIATIFAFLSGNRLRIDADKKNAEVLALAKAALINYAATSPHAADVATTRPGDFPCPDRNNDGLDNDGPCGAGAIGRIPWGTLGIPTPVDVNGETLWYAISGNFRNTTSNPGSQINSDTLGTLTVYASDGTTPLTTQAVAVLLAPGGAVASQIRDAANVNTPASYLDTLNGRNNASGPFIVAPTDIGQTLTGFNDQIVYITTSDLIPSMELNVAGIIKSVLTSYRSLSLCSCYPWAADFSLGLNISLLGYNRGRLPVTLALPENWGTNGSSTFPAWFTANNWQSLIYYTVAKQSTALAGLLCLFCTATTLSVDGTAGYNVVFFTPGPAVTGQTRPSNNVSDYLSDAQNSNNDDSYVTPTSTAQNRNRLFKF